MLKTLNRRADKKIKAKNVLPFIPKPHLYMSLGLFLVEIVVYKVININGAKIAVLFFCNTINICRFQQWAAQIISVFFLLFRLKLTQLG